MRRWWEGSGIVSRGADAGSLEDLFDHLADALVDLMYRGITIHVGGGGDDVLVFVDAGFGHGAFSVGGAHSLDGLGGLGIVADGDGAAGSLVFRAEYLGGDDRGNAAESDGLAVAVETLDDFLDGGVDGHVRALDREVAEVLGGSEATREYDGVEILRSEVGEGLDVASGNASGFLEDVAGFALHGLLGEMVDDVHLEFVRCEALDLRSEA